MTDFYLSVAVNFNNLIQHLNKHHLQPSLSISYLFGITSPRLTNGTDREPSIYAHLLMGIFDIIT